MNRLLKNKVAVAVLLVGLALLAGRNWYTWLSGKNVPIALPANLPKLPGLPFNLNGPSQPAAPAMAAPMPDLAGGEDSLQIRRAPGEDVVTLGSRFGLSKDRLAQLDTRNKVSNPEDRLVVLFPRDWRPELKAPRDPFLWPSEDPWLVTIQAKEPGLQALSTLLRLNGLAGDGGTENLQVVVVADRGSGAINVGGHIVRVGDQLGAYRVLSASVDGVLLKNITDGVKTWLSFREGSGGIHVELAAGHPGGEKK